MITPALKWSPVSRPGISRSRPAEYISIMIDSAQSVRRKVPSVIARRNARMKWLISEIGASKLVIRARMRLFFAPPRLRICLAPMCGR